MSRDRRWLELSQYVRPILEYCYRDMHWLSYSIFNKTDANTSGILQ